MLKIYNTNAITRQQRFSNAILTGSLAMLGCAVVICLVTRLTYVYVELLLAVMGYVTGMVIQKYGRGVQVQFSVLAAGLTLLGILICDYYVCGSFTGIAAMYSFRGINLLWTVGYRIVALLLAYRNARVIY